MTALPKTLALPFDIDILIDICKRHDVSWIGVFGSMARGEATSTSDIDLLVRFVKPKSLIQVITLEQQLVVALGRDVDLLTEPALSPYLRDQILGNVQVVYEA